MRLMKILKKPQMLWSRFVAWRAFHHRYGLAQVVVYISTGRWQRAWIWNSGMFTLLDSSTQQRHSVCKLTRRVQLTLVRSYVYRARIIIGPDGLSKPTAE